MGDFRHLDIENIQILAFDQVKEEIQRTFKSLQDDLKSIRGNIKIQRVTGEPCTTAKGISPC